MDKNKINNLQIEGYETLTEIEKLAYQNSDFDVAEKLASGNYMTSAQVDEYIKGKYADLQQKSN